MNHLFPYINYLKSISHRIFSSCLQSVIIFIKKTIDLFDCFYDKKLFPQFLIFKTHENKEYK